MLRALESWAFCLLKKHPRLLVSEAVIVLLLVGMFVMSYIAVDMAKEMRGTSDGVMQNGDGETVKVGDRWLSVVRTGGGRRRSAEVAASRAFFFFAYVRALLGVAASAEESWRLPVLPLMFKLMAQW